MHEECALQTLIFSLEPTAAVAFMHFCASEINNKTSLRRQNRMRPKCIFPYLNSVLDTPQSYQFVLPSTNLNILPNNHCRLGSLFCAPKINQNGTENACFVMHWSASSRKLKCSWLFCISHSSLQASWKASRCCGCDIFSLHICAFSWHSDAFSRERWKFI